MSTLSRPVVAPAERDSIETLIDRCGLANVLDAIGDILNAKAAHIRENWQDDRSGSMWERAAGIVETARAKPAVEIVSM